MNNNFDIKSYLESKDIPYKTSGKNISKGWIGTCCILPNCFDSTNHLGIHIKSGIYKCWICGRKGHVVNLIQIIEKCSEGVAKQIMKRFPLDEIDSIWDEEENTVKNTNLILPPEIEKEWPQIHLEYLKSRNFDPQYLIKKYKLMPVYTMGVYRFRIIIPIYINQVMVSFTSMDILRQDKRPHYIDCPINKAIIPVKHCLYNIDCVKDRVVIYEGVTGVWRFGEGSICSFTSNLTKEQISLLLKKKIKEVFILFDPDAEEKGNNIAIQLSGIIRYVEQIKFKNGDPKDLSISEVNDLKRDLKFI